MQLDGVVEAICADLRRAGAIGGEEAARLAELLVAGIEPSVRLHLLEGLHQVAADLEASAPGAVVSVRLDGRDPVLALEVGPAEEAAAPGPASESWADDELLRLTIRLPEGLKARVEQAAAVAGASINSWIVAVLARALDGASPPGPHPGRRMPRRITGFVQG